MTPDERQQFETLKAIVYALVRSDRLTFEKHLQLLDGRNIQLGTTTGTKIGTATDQKLGFYGIAPVAQQVRPTDAASIITTGTTLGLWA